MINFLPIHVCSVDHRIGGLESWNFTVRLHAAVDHRIGGLENRHTTGSGATVVDHRIGGLEICRRQVPPIG